MDRSGLQALQAPLKDQYRTQPEAAVYTLRADGRLGEENVSCSVETGRALVEAGLHSATGGGGGPARSRDIHPPARGDRARGPPQGAAPCPPIPRPDGPGPPAGGLLL